MSFGYSVSDAVLLVQLAWKTLQNSRRACGEHDELTQEISSIHVVLGRLELEVRSTDSPINRPKDTCHGELQAIASGCQNVLDVLDKLLDKYNRLGPEGKGARKLWQQIRFGNGEMMDLGELRGKLVYYTSAMSVFLHMVTMGSISRVEKQMDLAGGDLKDIKLAVNGIAGLLVSRSHHEGSVLTAYGDDDRTVWKDFRRELLKNGFSSTVLQKHKDTIKAYVMELGERGLLDEEDTHLNDSQEHHARSMKIVDHVNRVTSLPLNTVTKLDHTAIAMEAKQSQSVTAELSLSADIVKIEVDEPLIREPIREYNTESKTSYEAISAEGPIGSIKMASPSLAGTSAGTAVSPTVNTAPTVARPGMCHSEPGELRENHAPDVDNAGTDYEPQCERLKSGVTEQLHKSTLRNEKQFFVERKRLHALLEHTSITDFNDISRIFRLGYEPQCERLISEVRDQVKRSIFPNETHFREERERLSESIRSDVLIKLDLVDVGHNDDLKIARESLIQEVRAMLTALDRSCARVSSITCIDILWHRYYELCAPHCIKHIMSHHFLNIYANTHPAFYAEGSEIRNLLFALGSIDTTGDRSLSKIAQQLKADMNDMLKLFNKEIVVNSKLLDVRDDINGTEIGKGERIFSRRDSDKRCISFHSASKCPYVHDAAWLMDLLNLENLAPSGSQHSPELGTSPPPIPKNSRNRRATSAKVLEAQQGEDPSIPDYPEHGVEPARYRVFEEGDDLVSETETSPSHSRHRSRTSSDSDSELSNDTGASLRRSTLPKIKSRGMYEHGHLKRKPDTIPPRPPRDTSTKPRHSSDRPMVPRSCNTHPNTPSAACNLPCSPRSRNDCGDNKKETTVTSPSYKSQASLVLEYFERKRRPKLSYSTKRTVTNSPYKSQASLVLEYFERKKKA